MASELGVQTIQHTNGTDALTISSGGIVTESQKPVLHLSADSSGSQAYSDGVTKDVTWNHVDLDTVSGWDSVNYRYTPGVAGWYMVTASLRVATSSFASRLQLTSSVSGTPVDRIQYVVSSSIFTDGTYPFTNRLFYLTASDYINFIFYSAGSAGTLHDQSDQQFRSRLSIFLVQPA